MSSRAPSLMALSAPGLTVRMGGPNEGKLTLTSESYSPGLVQQLGGSLVWVICFQTLEYSSN